MLTGADHLLRIEPNFDYLIDKLIEYILPYAVIKNAKVHLVEQLRDSVQISYTPEHKISCDVVIIAIPLQAVHEIHFEPDLPKKYIPANMRPPNIVTSFVCDFGPNFGPALTMPPSIMWLRPKMVACPFNQNGVLYGTVYTKYQLRITHQEPIKELFLSTYLPKDDDGPAMRRELTWTEHYWTPNLLCGLPSNKKWKRVIWAGTNSGLLYRGYANGAVQGGMSAALQTLKMLRPGAVGWADTAAVHRANVVREPPAGFVERKLMSLNLYNSMFFVLVVCPVTIVSYNYLAENWKTINRCLSF